MDKDSRERKTVGKKGADGGRGPGWLCSRQNSLSTDFSEHRHTFVMHDIVIMACLASVLFHRSVYSYVGSAWFEIFNKCWWLEVKLQVFLFFVAKSTRTFSEKGKRGLSLSNPVVSVANVNSVLGRKHGVCNAHCRVAVSSRYFIYRKQWTRYEWWS